MTNKQREQLTGEAEVLQKVWLRHREEQRAAQVAANVEIRQRWAEIDSTQNGSGAADQQPVTAWQTDRPPHRNWFR